MAHSLATLCLTERLRLLTALQLSGTRILTSAADYSREQADAVREEEQPKGTSDAEGLERLAAARREG